MAFLSVLRSARSLYTLADRLFTLRHRVGDTKAHAPVRLNVAALEERIVPDGRPLPFPTLFAASGVGVTSVARAYNAETGATNFTVTPFGTGFTAGMSVASADFNNDTIPDLLVGAGKGGGPRVRLFDGKTGEPIQSPVSDFFVFEPEFRGGVEVAAGDVDGDGRMDVIVAPGKGGGPRVRVFSGATGANIADFFAMDSGFRGGLNIASGDFDIDKKNEIVVGASAGGGPRVRIFQPDGRVINHHLADFFAFDAGDRAGVSLSVGDVNGDRLSDIIVGSGRGAESNVRVFNGRDGSTMADMAAFGESHRDGVRVASAYINDDRYADVVVSDDSRVRVFSGSTGRLSGMPLDDFEPFTAGNGLKIAAANDPGTEPVVMYDPEIDGVDGNDEITRGQQFRLSVRIDGTDLRFPYAYGQVAFFARINSSPPVLIPLGEAEMNAIDNGYARLDVKDVALPDDSYDIIAEYEGDTNYAADTIVRSSPMVVETPLTVPVSQAYSDSKSMLPTPTRLSQGSGNNSMPSVGDGMVELLDGSISLTRKDLVAEGFGAVWSQNWTWTNAVNIADGGAGAGSRSTPIPSLVNVHENSVAVVENSRVQFFDKFGDVYHARLAEDFRFEHDNVNGRYIWTDGGGNQFRFYDFAYSTTSLQGKLEKYIDASGAEIVATSYTGAGRIQEIQRVEGSGGTAVTESMLYAYIGSGANANQIQTVTHRRKVGTGSWGTVRSVEYQYYDGSQTYGLATDLRKVILKDSAGSAIDTTYYRYYTGSSSTGYAHGLKFVFGPRAYERLVDALGSSIDGLTDAQVDDYADNYLEYNSAKKVTKHVAAAEGCSACSGGQGEYAYSYTENDNIGNSNVWRYKAVETLPDGNTNTVYLNANGQVMLWGRSQNSASIKNFQFQRFNRAAQVVQTASPAALISEDVVEGGEDYMDLLNDQGGDFQFLRDDAGMVTTTTYGTETLEGISSSGGDVEGFVQAVSIQPGEFGTAIPQAAMTYIAVDAAVNGQRTFFPLTSTRYRDTLGYEPQTTTMAYTWQGDTAEVGSTTVTLPTVTSAQNGSDIAISDETVNDAYGWPVWHKRWRRLHSLHRD